MMNLGFIALALWLARYDIARKTVRRPGITRFVAVNLLLGYGWLALGGLIGLCAMPASPPDLFMMPGCTLSFWAMSLV